MDIWSVLGRYVGGSDILRHDKREELGILQLLEILGGKPEGKQAAGEYIGVRVGGEVLGIYRMILAFMGVDEIESEVARSFRQRVELKQRKPGDWGLAFEGKLEPHLIDAENYEAKKVFGKAGGFYWFVFSILAKRIGRQGAEQYVEMCCSFIIEHFDIYLRHVHGHSGEINKKPLGLMYVSRGDNNIDQFSVKDYEFMMEVVGESSVDPYKYDIKATAGDGIEERRYKIDVGGSLLELTVGNRYKVICRGYQKTTRRLSIEVKGARREDAGHLLIPVDHEDDVNIQPIKRMVVSGVQDFLKTEYKRDQEDVEKYTKSIEKRISDLELELVGAEKAGKDTSGIEKELQGLQKHLGDLKLVGGFDQQLKEIKEILQRHPKHEKMEKYPIKPGEETSPAPVVSEAESGGINQEEIDAAKFKLTKSLSSMHGDYKGIPYTVLGPMFFSAVMEANNPEHWAMKFVPAVNKYIEDKGLDIKWTSADPTRFQHEIKTTLLSDPGYKRLRENLSRSMMLRTIKAALEQSDVRRLEQEVRGWFKQLDARALVSAYELAVSKIDVERRKVIDAAFEAAFREYVLMSAEHLESALEILVSMNTVMKPGDGIFVKCKRLFLSELYKLEVEKFIHGSGRAVLDEPLFVRLVGLYRGFIKKIKSDPYVADISDGVYNTIKKVLEHGEVPMVDSGRRKQDRKPKVKKDVSDFGIQNPEISRMRQEEEEALKLLRV